MATENHDEAHLVDLKHIPPMEQYLSDLWDRRQFAILVPYNDIRVQNMNTTLGQFWHVINPAMQIGVYFFVFGVVLGLNSRGGVDNYLAFLIVGVLLFQLSSRVLMDSIRSMERDEGLIRSVQFPRALLPISSVIEQTMAFVPAAAVLLVALLLTGELPDLRWLAFPFVLAIQFLINVGMSLLGARAGFAIRDLSQIINHIVRMLFYFSGVIFDISRFEENMPSWALPLFALNPFYDILVVARWSLINGEFLPEAFLGFFVYAIILPVIGMSYFVKAEHRYGG